MHAHETEVSEDAAWADEDSGRSLHNQATGRSRPAEEATSRDSKADNEPGSCKRDNGDEADGRIFPGQHFRRNTVCLSMPCITDCSNHFSESKVLTHPVMISLASQYLEQIKPQNKDGGLIMMKVYCLVATP